jgi:hypothetical protein
MSGLDNNSYTFTSVTTTPYTVTNNDYVVSVNINGASVVNLPQASTVPTGRIWIVKQVASASAAVTVKSTTSTIDGTAGATGVLVKASNAAGALQLVSDGTNWQIIGIQ